MRKLYRKILDSFYDALQFNGIITTILKLGEPTDVSRANFVGFPGKICKNETSKKYVNLNNGDICTSLP